MADTINNSEDIIDSRQVIERIEELESLVEDGDAERDDIDELATLKSVAEECEHHPDWPYGETLIRDSYFKTYAMDLADDLGMIRDNTKWPYTCIDWDMAARDLQVDYSVISFDGVDYWIRS